MLLFDLTINVILLINILQANNIYICYGTLKIMADAEWKPDKKVLDNILKMAPDGDVDEKILDSGMGSEPHYSAQEAYDEAVKGTEFGRKVYKTTLELIEEMKTL